MLRFERENRAYFARSVPDRGDAYFASYDARHATLLDEQDRGTGAYYLLVDDDGSVAGRFNLVLDGDGGAEVGYRVGERHSGHGLAGTTLRELCTLAWSRHGLRLLHASTTDDNLASQRVLAKAGFVPVGPADPQDIGGQTGIRWERAVDPVGSGSDTMAP